jgi:hypothetical protein
MEKDIVNLTSKLKKLVIEKKPNLPPLKGCKKCPYNVGSPVTGLCASCDDNHPMWTLKNGFK